MYEGKGSANDRRSVNHLTRLAIHATFGTIDRLPQNVIERIIDVYSEFIPVYIEMVRIKDNHPRDWQPGEFSIDPEIVEDMLHFFSDYQHITRNFTRLNNQVKTLMALDMQSDRGLYGEWVKKIVHGQDEHRLMDSILGQ